MPDSANYLEGVANDILQASLSGLAQSCTGRTPPGRVYVSHGPSAVDACEGTSGQLTVHLERLEMRPAGVQQRGVPGGFQCQIMPVARFVVELFRCVPVPNDRGVPPTEEELDLSAVDLMEDAWSIVTYLIAERASGDLIHGLGCDGVGIGVLSPIVPNGGVAGWSFTVEVLLNDRGPCFGS